MVLMHNATPFIDLAQTHGQSKFEFLSLAVRIDARAFSYCGSEGHVRSSSDLDVVKVKGDWPLGPRQKELFPSRHVSVQPSRQQWGRHIEHQHLGVVIRANRQPVLFA